MAGALEMSCRFLVLLAVNYGNGFTKHCGEFSLPWLFSLHLGLGGVVCLFVCMSGVYGGFFVFFCGFFCVVVLLVFWFFFFLSKGSPTLTKN